MGIEGGVGEHRLKAKGMGRAEQWRKRDEERGDGMRRESWRVWKEWEME